MYPNRTAYLCTQQHFRSAVPKCDHAWGHGGREGLEVASQSKVTQLQLAWRVRNMCEKTRDGHVI